MLSEADTDDENDGMGVEKGGGLDRVVQRGLWMGRCLRGGPSGQATGREEHSQVGNSRGEGEGTEVVGAGGSGTRQGLVGDGEFPAVITLALLRQRQS